MYVRIICSGLAIGHTCSGLLWLALDRDRHLGVYGGFKTESLFVPILCNVDPWADRMRYVLILGIRGSESSSSLAH